MDPHVVGENGIAYSHCWLNGVHCWLDDFPPPLFAVEGTNIEEEEEEGGQIALSGSIGNNNSLVENGLDDGLIAIQ